MIFNSKLLKIEPCTVFYKGFSIGISENKPQIKVMPELYESIASKISDQNISKIIANMRFTVSLKVNVSSNVKLKNMLTGETAKTGGELRLYENPGGKACYCFPRALIIPETIHVCKSSTKHYLIIEFEVFEDSQGTLIQKIS